MQINQDANFTHHTIYAYKQGEISITLPFSPNENPSEQQDEDKAGLQRETLTDNLILMPDTLIHNWQTNEPGKLCVEDFAAVSSYQPEIILLGTGETLDWPEPALIQAMVAQGVGFEVMNTAAACRTYNILLSDGRRVAAALMIS